MHPSSRRPIPTPPPHYPTPSPLPEVQGPPFSPPPHPLPHRVLQDAATSSSSSGSSTELPSICSDLSSSLRALQRLLAPALLSPPCLPPGQLLLDVVEALTRAVLAGALQPLMAEEARKEVAAMAGGWLAGWLWAGLGF